MDMEAGREFDKWIAEKVFGLTGLGYYGPPDDEPFMHDRSVRHDTAAQANASYADYWDKYHSDNPHGFRDRDCWDADLCHWKDGWGPLLVDSYSTDLQDAWQLMDWLRGQFTNVALCSDKGWGLRVWDGTLDSACSNNFGPFNASTPEMAICLTAKAVVEYGKVTVQKS